MQVLKIVHFPAPPSLPPLYSWPEPLKRLILMAATGACLGAYVLFILGGALGVWLLCLLAVY